MPGLCARTHEPRVRLGRFSLLALALAALPAGAVASSHGPPTIPVIAMSVRPAGTDPAHDPTCLETYDNDSQITIYHLPAPGAVILDDLHMINTDPVEVCAVDVSYNSPNAATDVLIWFYENDGTDAEPRTVIAGPFTASGAPAGEQILHAEVPATTLGPNVWLGVSFSRIDAGLALGGFPSVGSSHDVAYETGLGMVLSQEPATNFVLTLYARPTVQTEDSTWGRVKAIHR